MDGKFKNYDFAIVIGRFQPLHLGHVDILNTANEIAHNVIVLLGSCNSSMNIRNPFNPEQRKAMLNNSLDFPFTTIEINDYLYNDKVWISQVQHKVSEAIDAKWTKNYEPKIALVGCKSDDSSYYLDLFPQWTYREADVTFPATVHATDIRESIFGKEFALESVRSYLPKGTLTFLELYNGTTDHKTLQSEHQYVKNYKSQWASAPFPPTFVTVDNVICHHGHVLLIKRKINPGKGLWALPGGFLNQNERIIDGAKRELLEETNLNLYKNKDFNFVESKVFDHPSRSSRGRAITHAFFYEGTGKSLPKVKGGDDAASASWVEINQAMASPKLFFEDHYHILSYFTSHHRTYSEV